MCILSVRGSDGANIARTAAALGPLELEAFEVGAWAFSFPAELDGKALPLYAGGRSEPPLYEGRVVAVVSKLLLVAKEGRRFVSGVVSSLDVLDFSSGSTLSTVDPDSVVRLLMTKVEECKFV